MASEKRHQLDRLDIQLPNYPYGDSNPFSNSRVDWYRPEDLKKRTASAKLRTEWFAQHLYAIWQLTEQPVPYAFETRDGQPRSLDAGCLGFLLNAEPPQLATILDNGFIVAVEPHGSLASRFHPIRDRLIAELQPNHERPQIDERQIESRKVDDQILSTFQLPFEPDENIDDRLRQLSIKTIREGRQAFRRQTLLAWSRSCALSGECTSVALEAAHIHRYGGAATNVACNAILLRADIHRLFDRHLISLRYEDGSLFALTSTKLAGSAYEVFHGQQVKLPIDLTDRPHPRLIERHHREFAFKNERN